MSLAKFGVVLADMGQGQDKKWGTVKAMLTTRRREGTLCSRNYWEIQEVMTMEFSYLHPPYPDDWVTGGFIKIIGRYGVSRLVHPPTGKWRYRLVDDVERKYIGVRYDSLEELVAAYPKELSMEKIAAVEWRKEWRFRTPRKALSDGRNDSK